MENADLSGMSHGMMCKKKSVDKLMKNVSNKITFEAAFLRPHRMNAEYEENGEGG